MIVRLYEKLFRSLYQIFKKTHPDPVFYTVLAIYFVLSFFGILILYWILNVYFQKEISKTIWFIISAVFFGINLWYFNDKRVKEIEKKYKK